MSYSRDQGNTRFSLGDFSLVVNNNLTLTLNPQNPKYVSIHGKNWTSYTLGFDPISVNLENCTIQFITTKNTSIKIQTTQYINDTSLFTSCGAGCWTYNINLQSNSNFMSPGISLLWILFVVFN